MLGMEIFGKALTGGLGLLVMQVNVHYSELIQKVFPFPIKCIKWALFQTRYINLIQDKNFYIMFIQIMPFLTTFFYTSKVHKNW